MKPYLTIVPRYNIGQKSEKKTVINNMERVNFIDRRLDNVFKADKKALS